MATATPINEFESITPIPIAGECDIYVDDEVYIIGFPYTPDRLKANHTFIANPDSVVRRWSQGYVVDFEYSDYYFGASTPQWLTTTADALPGNSGGPALSANGDLLGVVDSVKESNGNTDAYVGNDVIEPRRSHSLLTRCEDVTSFLTDAGFQLR